MGQIVKRKKKGRPSKADLAKTAAEQAAAASQSPATESDSRRSRRRRNVRYNFDYDDYLDEEEDDDEDEESDDDEDDRRRKEKKLKLVLKLPTVDRSRTYARDGDANESGDDSDDRRRTRRKRNQIDDDGEDDCNDNANDNDGDEDNEIHGNEDEDDKGRPRNSKGGQHSVPNIPSEMPSTLPLPSDRKNLEIILDKLQKKDVYGVYAEPVDPEELPDYHEVIENPMDFSTVRKKLATGSYSTLKQIESDIYLICANAMQYNAADTVYYKQARTIQELAKRKFLKVRLNVEKELKSEQRTLPNSTPKKQISPLVSLTSQELVRSDFSVPTAVNPRSSPNVKLPGISEKQSNGGGSMEGNYSLFDSNLEKTHDLSSGKGHMYHQFGKKPNVLDDDRRTTYNTTNHPITKSQSVYATFEGEHKHLVAVGLHTDHSYARSMARFAAALAPFGWNIASKKIEQALPTDVKYGRGWVGEYEPLPTLIVLNEKHTQKATAFFRKSYSTAGYKTSDRILNTSIPVAKEVFASGSVLEGKLFGCPASSGTKPFTPINNVGRQQNPFSKNHFVSANKAVNQVEVNFSITSNQNKANAVRQNCTESPRLAASRALGTVPDKKQTVNRTVSIELPNGAVINSNSDSKRLISSSAGSVPNQMARPETFSPRESFPNQMVRPETFSPHGNVPYQMARPETFPPHRSVPNQMVRPETFSPHGNVPYQMAKPETFPPHGSVPNQMVRPETFSPHGNVPNQMTRPETFPPREQMRSVHEMAQRAQVNSNNQLMDSHNAATTAAREWMSIGAGGFKPTTTEGSNQHQLKGQISADSLYNPARNNLNPQMLQFRGQFPPAQNNNFVSQQHHPIQQAAETQFQNTPTVYPHLRATDLSKFQMQKTNWRGLSPHVQQRKNQDTFPPDLNISFQSSAASPVRQSTGVLVDSQQPDLALQL